MTAVGDMKKHVASLVEANRALASDLKASRTTVAKIQSERRTLVDELRYIEHERNELKAQLAEATDALDEIRDSLRSSLGTMEPRGREHRPRV